MNFDDIKAAATSKAAVAIFKTRKHSPHILFGAGVVGFGATVFLAVRATNKVSEKVDRAAAAKVAAEKPMRKYQQDATPEEIERDVRNLKVTLAGDIAKTYALPIAVGLATLGCFGGAHYILNKRNAGLLVAYGALDRAYTEYRKRVVAEYGEDVDREFTLGVEDTESFEKMADGKEVVTVSKGVRRVNNRSPYAVCFDEQSRFFTREPGMNQNILEIKRSQANDKMLSNGHLFLNEVYDLLGLPRTTNGSIVGWIYDPQHLRADDQEVKRDNFITFGLWMNDPDYVDAIIDGATNMGIWLDFNVDGVIWDKI